MQILTRAAAKGFTNVRLVGEGQNEIVSITSVFSRAEDEGLDVVLVSDQSTPPVVRIQDYQKIQYEQKKAKQKHGKTSELKEIQLRVNISDHDLNTKLNNVRKFLDRGDKVKVLIRLKGRERENPERAQLLLERVVDSVTCRLSRIPGPIVQAILEPPK